VIATYIIGIAFVKFDDSFGWDRRGRQVILGAPDCWRA
jgi:hypothetical protein